jgi:dephospho-CoA kinase
MVELVVVVKVQEEQQHHKLEQRIPAVAAEAQVELEEALQMKHQEPQEVLVL